MIRSITSTALKSVEADPVMLVVGDGRHRDLSDRIGGPGIHFVPYADLDQPLLAGLYPDIVVSALMSPVVDAIDLAARLDHLGYRGLFWALASTVPRIPMVRQEVNDVAPNIEFEIVTLSAISDLIQEQQGRRLIAP